MFPRTLWLISTVVFITACIMLVGLVPTVVVSVAMITWSTLNLMNETLAAGHNLDEEWQNDLDD